MITLYSGTPGSGKSYFATRRIYEALNRPHPKPVICNYDIRHDARNYDHFHYLPNEEITPEYLKDFSKDWFASHPFGEDRILLIIDEVQVIANSRTWSDKGRLGMIVFLSQHRHFGYEIVMIAQSDKMIDRQFRPLIEYETKFRKLANFGIVGFVLSLVALGRVFCGVTTYYGLHERIGVKFFVPRKKVFALYDSYSEFKEVSKDSYTTLVNDPSE